MLSERLYDALVSSVHLHRQSLRFAHLRYSSEVIPLSSLCIQRGKAVWVLYIDTTCINFDGNAFDAALIAILAALKNSEQFVVVDSIIFINS